MFRASLKKLGVTNISSVFETGNRKLFKQIKPGDSFDEKIRLAAMINNAGLEMGSGLLAGLGCRNCADKCSIATQGKPVVFRYEDYVSFIFLMKSFKHLRSLYVSRFSPFKGIPLTNHPRCSAMEGARIIAIMRLVLRNVDIRLANGWSREDIPLWVSAGGGNNIVGVHINRAPQYSRNTASIPDAIEYHGNVEYRNNIPVTTKMLNEIGMSVAY